MTHKIAVNLDTLKEIHTCLETDGQMGPDDDWTFDGPFAAAWDAGFPGFAGGLDHIEITRRGWGVLIVDRGMSRGNRVNDNSTEFFVPKAERAGQRRGPLA